MAAFGSRTSIKAAERSLERSLRKFRIFRGDKMLRCGSSEHYYHSRLDPVKRSDLGSAVMRRGEVTSHLVMSA